MFGEFKSRYHAYKFLEYFRDLGFGFTVNGKKYFLPEDLFYGSEFIQIYSKDRYKIGMENTIFSEKDSWKPLTRIFFYGDRIGDINEEDQYDYEYFCEMCERSFNRIQND